MRIIVTGGRDFDDYDRVFWALLRYVGKNPTIVHGDAAGADTLAKHAARALGLPCEAHKANWKEHGPMAGGIRNAQMIDAGADGVLAFPGGKGTRNCVRLALAANIPVEHA
jgi:hypothetical protein